MKKFKEVLEIRPNHSYAYWGWGACLRSMELYEEAIEVFKMVLEIDPADPAAYGSWADCLKYQGLYQAADGKYQKAIEVDPTYIDGYMCWADSLYRQKRYDESAEKYKIAIEIAPDSEAMVGLIRNLIQLKRYEEAIDLIKKHLQAHPDNAYAYWGWGDCLRSMEKYGEAIEKFEKLSEITPNNPAAYGAWADCLRHQGLYQAADEKYQKAIEVDPTYGDAYRCWGRNLYLQKKYDKALEKYLKVLELQPKLEGSIVNVVDCLIRLKKYDQALAMCKQLLDTNQNSQGGIAGLIRVYSKMKRHTEVIDMAEVARINNVADCSSNLHLGKSYFALGQYKAALTHFDKVKSIHSDCESMNILRGLALAHLGETEEALFLIFKELATNNKKVQVDVDYWEECFEVLPDALKKLNAKMYIASFYNNETEARYTQVQICFFLILLDKYDIVTEYFQHMECEDNTPPPENLVAEEVTPFELLVFSIKFNIVWKLIENKLFEAIKLCEIYINYLNNIKDEEAKNY
jgi:tetratricopeptide (TPR) repeat protein